MDFGLVYNFCNKNKFELCTKILFSYNTLFVYLLNYKSALSIHIIVNRKQKKYFMNVKNKN